MKKIKSIALANAAILLAFAAATPAYSLGGASLCELILMELPLTREGRSNYSYYLKKCNKLTRNAACNPRYGQEEYGERR